MIKKFANNHEYFMQKALDQAHNAYQKKEVPIGCVVVDAHGVIQGRGYNQVEQRCTQAAHAEITALKQAGKKLKNWRLEGCTVYVTLEPCAMCMNLILLSRAAGVVYAARSPLFGYHLDNELTLSVYNRNAFKVVEGICAVQAQELLQKFFKEQRENRCEST